MSDDDECIHGLGLVSACVICNGRVAREAHALKENDNTIEYTFKAKFLSECHNCDGSIGVGDTVHMTASGKVVCCVDPTWMFK